MNNTTQMVTGKCRLSYSHIWDPASLDGVSDPKYSACIIIPKSDKETLEKINKAVKAATDEGVNSKWKGKKPASLKLPLRDGDAERPEDPAFANSYFMNASTKVAPGVVDINRQTILDTAEVYSGCFCRFSINFYPFAAAGNNGVACGLRHVQKIADGTPLGGGSRAEDDFDDDFTDDFDDLA